MIFRYLARNAAGQMREGTSDAESPRALASELSRAGLVAVRVAPAGVETPTGEKESFLRVLGSIGTVSSARKTLFYRQLAVVLGAGISLTGALSDLAAAERYAPLAKRIETVRRSVDAGGTLHESLRKGKLAQPLEAALLASGEEAGRLVESLETLARLCERRERLRGRIVSASVYPAFVLCLAAAVVGVMFRWVIPRFYQVYSRMNMEMPPLTERVFWLSRHVGGVLWGLFFSAAAAAAAWRTLRRVRSVRVLADRAKMSLPVVGAMIRSASLSRAFRALGTLLASGVPLLRALELAEAGTGNAAVREAFSALREAAARGEPLAETAAKTPFFRPVAFQLIAAGEKAGCLDRMLGRAADWHENELEEGVKRLGSALEPLLILVVGGVAGLVAAALFAPVLKAVSELSAAI